MQDTIAQPRFSIVENKMRSLSHQKTRITVIPALNHVMRTTRHI